MATVKTAGSVVESAEVVEPEATDVEGTEEEKGPKHRKWNVEQDGKIPEDVSDETLAQYVHEYFNKTLAADGTEQGKLRLYQQDFASTAKYCLFKALICDEQAKKWRERATKPHISASQKREDRAKRAFAQLMSMAGEIKSENPDIDLAATLGVDLDELQKALGLNSG